MVKPGGDSRSVMRRRIVVLIAAAAVCAVALLSIALVFFYWPGMDIVFYITLGCSLLIVAYLSLRVLRSSERHTRLAKVLQRCLLTCIAVGAAVFVLLQALIISGSRTDDAQFDCLIILGAGIYGETPSRTLAARLDAAIHYLGEMEEIPVIVSGGQGPGESITEAEAMSRYLIRRGVDGGRIWQEGGSTSTWENLAFSKELLEENGLDTSRITVAIVTNEFHLYRAKHVAGTLGMNAIGISARTPYPNLRVLYHCREALAILDGFIFGWNK